jgi:hypothetical protein
MVAVGERDRRFACRQFRQSARNRKPAGGADELMTAIPARVTITIVVHNRLTNVRYCRMRSTISANVPKGLDVKIVKGGAIVVKFPEGTRISTAIPTPPRPASAWPNTALAPQLSR